MRNHRFNLALLRRLNVGHRVSTQGFTLIELLVVVMILGILAAISLPGFTRQANRARESKAQLHISAVNRSQQAYRLENGAFSDSPGTLGLSEDDGDYRYTITANDSHAIVEAVPQEDLIKGFKGVVYILNGGIDTGLCEGTPGQVPTVCYDSQIAQATSGTTTASTTGSGTTATTGTTSGSSSTGSGTTATTGTTSGSSSTSGGTTATATATTGTAPGQSGTNPGQSGTNPGQSGTNPGQSGTNPGQSGTSPGQSKNNN